MNGPAPLSLDGLIIARLYAGDTGVDPEAKARALGGSLYCQRALADTFYLRYCGGLLTAEQYLDEAEPIARMAAATGDGVDLRRWASVLVERGRERLQSGAASAGITAQAEAALIFNSLADRGDDEAAALLDDYAPHMVPDALRLARSALRVRPLAPPAEAPVIPPPAIALDLGEETRWERLGWWFSDRWWAVRCWCSDRVRSLRCIGWAISDRLAARRGK